MRKAFPVLLLGCLLYLGWFYWRDYTDQPLRASLLHFHPEAVEKIEVTPPDGAAFRAIKDENGEWVLIRGAIQTGDFFGRVPRLLEQLLALETDSTGSSLPTGAAFRVRIASDRTEEVRFHFDKRDRNNVFATVGPDVFHLAASSGQLRSFLAFDAYRDRRLFAAPPALERLDSISLVRADTTRWVTHQPDTLGWPPSDPLAAASAPFADHFDLLEAESDYLGDLEFSDQGTKTKVGLYFNQNWPRPYVIASREFDRRYFSLDSLPLLDIHSPAYDVGE